MSLTKADKSFISGIVFKEINAILKPTGKLPPVTGGNVATNEMIEEVLDPVREAADKKVTEIINTLPTGTAIVRGRQGTQVIDRAAESLNTINELLKARIHKYTRSSVR